MDSECFYCGQEAIGNCSQCESFPYCSEYHLKCHRPAQLCLPFRIQLDPVKGHHLVASRDVKTMEILLEENPCVIGPYVKSPVQCLECFKPIPDVSQAFRCPGCQFPLCGEECSQSKLNHAQDECDQLSGGNLKIQKIPGDNGEKPKKRSKGKKHQETHSMAGSSACNFDYSIITVLRSLRLKERKPEVWNNIMQLVDHNHEMAQEGSPTWNLWMTEVIPRLKQFPGINEQEALRFLGIGVTNNANLNLTHGGRGTSLYPTFARINHQCICNTKVIKQKDHKLQVRASGPIEKGQEISNQYVKPLNNTAIRRSILRSKWYFECKCPRCSDPTELGSYLSAFICSKCKSGTVLAQDPLDPESLWICRDCSTSFTVDYLQARLNEILASIDSAHLQTNLIHRYEECLHKFSHTLHPGHQIFTDLNSQLAILYGNPMYGDLSSWSRPSLDRKIQACQQVLDTNGRVDPGFSAWREKILIELTRTKVHLAQRDLRAGVIGEDKMEEILGEQQFLGIYLGYYRSVLFEKK